MDVPARWTRSAHPVVVMAHGIGGVKAAGLAPFAERFAAGGFAAMVFDYRHWGRSSGQPRQLLSIRRQLDDYRTVLAWAHAQDGFRWHARLRLGHFVLRHACRRAGRRRTRAGRRHRAMPAGGRPGGSGEDPVVPWAPADGARGRRPDRVGAGQATALPGSQRAVRAGSELIATEDAMAGYGRLDPGDGSWSNGITARSVLDVTMHRPVRRAHRARCPLLMVVAEHDTMAPVGPALSVAARAPRGELYRSRGGHYDVYSGGLDHENVIRVELEFLRRHAGLPAG